MSDAYDVAAELSQWLAPYLQGASVAGRRQFSRAVARYLWRSQSARIRDQKNPDGSPFEKRRRGKSAMFEKIRQRPHLRTGASETELWVGFRGRAARIARVHQEGKTIAPGPGQKTVRYAERQLLGFTQQDIEQIKSLAETHLLPG